MINAWVERQTRAEGRDTNHLPAAQHTLGEGIFGGTEERQLVNVIERQRLRLILVGERALRSRIERILHGRRSTFAVAVDGVGDEL